MPRSARIRNHGLVIRYAHRAFVRALSGVLAEENLTSTQFIILRILWDENGLTQTELAQRLAMESPHVTATLDRMVKHGLILRRTNRQDRRRVNVMLTARARAMKKRMLPVLNPANLVAERGLPKRDIDTLHRVLRQMTENLEAHLRGGQAAAAIRARPRRRAAPLAPKKEGK